MRVSNAIGMPCVTPKNVRLKIAGPWLDALMRHLKCWGITMPWRTAYIGSHRDPKVMRHELVHLAQIRRDGDVTFWTKYLWSSLRYGYRANPYEIEADRIAGTARYKLWTEDEDGESTKAHVS